MTLYFRKTGRQHLAGHGAADGTVVAAGRPPR